MGWHDSQLPTPQTQQQCRTKLRVVLACSPHLSARAEVVVNLIKLRVVLASSAHLSARAEVVVRLRVLVADSMLQLLAQAGGSEASLLLLCRQLADRFTKMNPAQTTKLVREACIWTDMWHRNQHAALLNDMNTCHSTVTGAEGCSC